MTPDEVNHSQVGNVFMLGAGGVIGKSLTWSHTCAPIHPTPPY